MEESIGNRRRFQKESCVKESKPTDERKTTKNKQQQAKTTPEKEDSKTNYSDLNKQVKRSCRADKSKWIQKNKKRLKSKNDAKTLYRINKNLTDK